MIAIHQFVPTVTRRDAIGHHVLELREVIRSLGVSSDIFAVEVHSDLDREVRPYQEYDVGDGPTALLYHAATTSVLAEFLVQRPEPKIVDYHNITPTRFFTGWDPGHAVAVRDARIEIAAIVRTVDLVFTHSHFSARDIEGWGYAHPIVAPVLGASFLDPAAVDDREPASTRAAVGDRSAVWLFVGRLAPNKAQEQLIKALTIYRRTYDLPAELHLVGSATPPAYRDALDHLAVAAGVADAVHFHEGVPAEDLATLYRTADVFVSASAHEGYCVPVIEAMRFGLPVVARAAGAVPETAGGAAVLVPGDSASALAVAVHRVLADPALADRLAAAGRARAVTIMTREQDDYRDALRALVEKMSVKVAFVVPRYGDEVFGGAERAAQQLAERLHARRGWHVEVLTTCALDYISWENSYAPGGVDLRGVQVHRFASRRGRGPDFDGYSGRILAAPEQASPAEQVEWIHRQGPDCPELLDAIRGSDADLITFHPYLYAPTALGLPLAGTRAVLHPSAHDEVPIRLPLFRDVFAAARALVFWTCDEQALTNRMFPVATSPQLVLGLGVESSPGDPDAASAVTGLGDRPYLLCLGRVDDAKGTGPLVRWFAAYKDRHPGPLALVLAGPVVAETMPHPDVILTGSVDESTKWGLLEGAEVVVVPSFHESFSLVLLEGWVAGKPALVNGACTVTRAHARRSGGGLWFDDYAHFEVALERLMASNDLRAELGDAGRRYVTREYAWPTLIDRYGEFLERVAALVA